MSGIPHSSNIIILCSTHPTPFIPTAHRSRRTFHMIATIHFLNPSPTETRFRIIPQPGPGFGICSKLLGPKTIQVFRTVDVGMNWSATLQTGFEVTCKAREVGIEF
jgi:hypothetical protein